MPSETLHPYLPKLKPGDTNENSVTLPVTLAEWDKNQATTRFTHLAQAIEAPPNIENVHSIPDPWARVILFSRALRDENHPLHARIVGEWRGLLAILGLKEILRFSELGARLVTLDPRKADPDSFYYAIARVLPGNEDAVSPKASWAGFHLLRWLGEMQQASAVPRAFGLTSPWTLVATGSYYADVLSEAEVPWFVDGILQDPCKHLSAAERSALAEWILHVREELSGTGRGPRHGEIARRLDSFARDLDRRAMRQEPGEILSRNTIGLDGPEFYRILNYPHKSNADLITSVKIVASPGRAGAPDLVLIDDSLPEKLHLPSREISISGDITLANAVRHLPGLAVGETSGLCPQYSGAQAMRWCRADYFFQSDLIYEQPLGSGGLSSEDTFPQCRKVNAEGRSAGRHIALPLNEEVTRLFTAKYLEDNFQIVWLDGGGAICRLRLEVQALAVPDAQGQQPQPTGPVYEVMVEHTYSQSDMIRVTKLPAVCVWPNFRFEDEADPKNPLPDGTYGKKNRWTKYFLFESWRGGNKDEFVVTPLGAQAGDSRLVREEGEYFQITSASRFPEFLVCRMPFNRNKQRTNDSNPPKGLLLLQEPEVLDVRHGRGAALGIDFGTTGTSVYSVFDVDDPEVAKAEKPARVSFKDRLFRVAVGDQNEFARATRDFFVPGQDWASGKILSVFQDFGASDDGTHMAIRDGHVLFAQDAKSNSFVTGTEESIKTNLKWGADRRENFAARDFLSQICIQSLAELVAGGATSIDIRYSYPTAFSDADIEHFNSVWKMVINHLKTATGVPVTNAVQGEVNCEAVAATRFFAHSENAVRLNVYSGAVTLDIGGGTTDIAVWNRDPNNFEPALQAHLSVLFAGRDIFLAPLRLKPGLLKVIDESKQMEGALSALGNLKKQSSAYNAEVDAIVSKYGNGLLEKLPGVARERDIEQFLEILELGLCGIAFYTGLLVGRLVLAGRYDPMQSRIPVFLGGNGSKLINWCALGEAQSSSMIVRKFGGCLLSGANFASGQKLQGNQVEVSLSYRPKEEVAFGLLVKDTSPYRTNDFINPLPGENYFVGPASNLEEREWSRAPDMETFRTKPVTVNRRLEVLREFLKAMDLSITDSEAHGAADDVDRELGRLSTLARETPMRGSGAKPEDSIRKEPMFIIALKHLINERINKLVNHA